MLAPLSPFRALRRSRLGPLVDLSPGLVAVYSLDEASGTRSGGAGGLDLTDNNTVTQAAGKVGNAAQFTAANSEYLSRADEAALRLNDGDWTVAGWVWFDSLGGGIRPVISKEASGARAWGIYAEGSLRAMIGDGGSNVLVVSSGVTPTTGQWYFVAARHTLASTLLEVRVDANTWASDTYAFTAGTSTAPLWLGQHFAQAGYHNGRLDAWALWERKLTDSDVDAYYNAGNGRAL
jgi:hypothetical protein